MRGGFETMYQYVPFSKVQIRRKNFTYIVLVKVIWIGNEYKVVFHYLAVYGEKEVYKYS